MQRFLGAGFAVSLYDKPGSGQSTGEFDNPQLFAQRASIVLDAIAWLKRHPQIDARGIGLYGSGQASHVITATLARTGEVAFVIAWSWPMQNSIEQSGLVRNYLLCEGDSEPEADAGRAQTDAEEDFGGEEFRGLRAIGAVEHGDNS